MNIKSEQEMLEFGQDFASQKIQQNSSGAILIELVGDVGAGKTTFTRGLAQGLGVKEPITSPSFTISKSYALPGGGNLVHYDFYRLSDPGLMIDDLQENLQNPHNIIVVEWGESLAEFLPKNHLKIHIAYTETGDRKVTL
ncbi:MAG: tRNA (adenosine(37)-N6)-threonylcarbamoyltransferase complex ATPase subunit type 1 TsaE [Candidatus Saccharibacteria bacterium]|nr:tRNA (adenosine(37)-N6)-threonylcarbamoyltransferase complex ATPase subunit type 1 TsaE [Candidatus Saccharibacteria bacterium]